MKFIELGESYRLPVRGTKEYQELQVRVSKSLRELTDLKDVPGFNEVVITKFKSTKNSFGEFVAEMAVILDKEEHEANTDESMTVPKALKNAANNGRIGNLKVDPKSLSLKEPGKIFVLFLLSLSRKKSWKVLLKNSKASITAQQMLFSGV